MKKFLFLMLMMMSLPAFAQAQWSCPVEPYPVSGTTARILNNATGVNFLSELAVEKIIQYNLKKNTNSDFDVKLKAFSAKNLAEGKFKSLSVSAKEAQIGGFYMENVHALTMCGYNRVQFKKNEPPAVFEDFVAQFRATITNDSLAKTIASQEFQNIFNSIDIKTEGVKLLGISSPEIVVENGQIRYTLTVEVPLLFANVRQTVTALGKLKVSDGKIEFADVEILGIGKFSTKLLTSIFNKINPFQFNFEKSLKTPSFLVVKDVNIINNQIELSGVFVAPKNQAAVN